MKAREVMSSHPLLVPPTVRDHELLGRLMDDAGTRHLAVVEKGRLLGAWVADPGGGVIRVGRDRVAEIPADADAEEAVRVLLDGAEAVLVRETGDPVGIITRSDVLAIVRAAIAKGIGRRHARPAVIRIAGAAGAGKSRLIRRTVHALPERDVVVVQANPTGPAAVPGGREVRDPSAHWRAGLSRVVRDLADVQVILLEDRDGDADLARGIGEDAQVAVAPVDAADGLDGERLADAQAVVLTHVDEAAPAAVRRAVERLGGRCPGLRVMPVGLEDDSGFDEWIRWLDRQVLRHRG